MFINVSRKHEKGMSSLRKTCGSTRAWRVEPQGKLSRKGVGGREEAMRETEKRGRASRKDLPESREGRRLPEACCRGCQMLQRNKQEAAGKCMGGWQLEEHGLGAGREGASEKELSKGERVSNVFRKPVRGGRHL